MRLSVVIVHWIRPELLGRCLAALANQSERGFELVLVDNGSEGDGFQAALSETASLGLAPSVVRLAENRGFAGGVNAGIRAASGELIALLNDDTEVEPDWSRALLAAADHHPWADVFACRMLAAPGGHTIDCAGILLSFFGEAAGRGLGRPDGPEFDEDQEVFGACAGAAMYRRRLLERVGLFDERYFHTCEDVDHALRVRLAGGRCLYVARSRVLHLGGASRERTPLRSVFLQSRNVELAFFSNFPLGLLLRVLPWHLARVAWGLLSRIGSAGFGPYLSGKLAAAREWRWIATARRERLSTATLSSRELWRQLDRKWHLERLRRITDRLFGLPAGRASTRRLP